MGGVRPAVPETVVGLVALLVSGCGTSQPNPSAAPLPGVTTLWPDVPAFADATPDLDSNRFFNSSPSQMMTIDYHTNRAPSEVAAFYSDALMRQNGWSPQPYGEVNHFSVGHGQGPQVPFGTTAGGCATGEFHGKPSADCTFSKTDEAGRNIELTIFIGPDDKRDLTLVDYTRIVGSAPEK